MELSGLIFVALALVWAVVLIPKALKHHDEAAETRSVDRVSGEARVLNGRDRSGVATGAGAAAAPRVLDRREVHAHQRAAAAAARRRRWVLASLLLLVAAVGGGAAQGLLLAWAPIAPTGALLGFLLVARVTVRRERARWDRRMAAHRIATHRMAMEKTATAGPGRSRTVVPEPRPDGAREVAGSRTGTAVAPESEGGDSKDDPEPVRNDQGLAVVSGLDDTSSIPVVLADLASTEGDRGVGGLWDPVPVTLPTYVGKPRASRTVRTIDLGAPDVASSGRDAADSALVAEAATAATSTGEATATAVGGTDGQEPRAIAT